MRALLRLRADDAAALDAARDCGADAIWLLARDAETLGHAVNRLASGGRPRVYLELAAEGRGATQDDVSNGSALIEAALEAGAAGFVLPCCRGVDEILRLGARLAVAEAERGLPDGSSRLIAGVAAAPGDVFQLGFYARAGRRLAALMWEPQPFLAALGGADESSPALVAARGLAVLAAHAAGAPAIDASFIEAADPAFFAERWTDSRRAGFSGAATDLASATRAVAQIFS